MIIISLLLALFISLGLHVSFLIRYIKLRNARYLKLYINTTISNVLISGGLIFVALYKPETLQQINLKLFIWLISGVIMVLALLIKVGIFRRIYRRSKLPEHYHLNFFGKKVLHASVVKPMDIGLFFATMPFFLFAGSYFIARLIKLFMNIKF